jgi:hypothetical protein
MSLDVTFLTRVKTANRCMKLLTKVQNFWGPYRTYFEFEGCTNSMAWAHP